MPAITDDIDDLMEENLDNEHQRMIEDQINIVAQQTDMLLKDFNALYSISTAIVDKKMNISEAAEMLRKQLLVINNNMKLKYYPYKIDYDKLAKTQ